MLSIILNHIQFLGFCLILFEVFSKITALAFGIIQIPFALISRTAVYAVMVFRTYFLSLFSAVCIMIAAQNNLSTIPFLVVFACILFGEVISPYKNNEDEPSTQNYIACSAVVSVILFLLLYFSNTFPLIAVPRLFFSAAAWILNLPIIGSILNFLLPFLCFITCVFLLFNAILLIIAVVSSIIAKINLVKQ